MVMPNVNCTVYFRENGSSKIYSVEQAKSRVGSYGIRWYEGKRQRQEIIGTYPAASAAKLRKELELKKACRKANSAAAPEELVKVDVAIETFVREREDLNSASARRWKIELARPVQTAVGQRVPIPVDTRRRVCVSEVVQGSRSQREYR